MKIEKWMELGVHSIVRAHCTGLPTVPMMLTSLMTGFEQIYIKRIDKIGLRIFLE